MFADIEAVIYVLVDGDDTYEAAAAPEMVRLLIEDRLHMVTGLRTRPYRRGLPSRAQVRQPAVDRLGPRRIRAGHIRRAIRLSGVQPALREVVSGGRVGF